MMSDANILKNLKCHERKKKPEVSSRLQEAIE